MKFKENKQQVKIKSPKRHHLKKNMKKIPFYTVDNVINNHIALFKVRIILYHYFHKYFFLLAFALKIKIRDV